MWRTGRRRFINPTGIHNIVPNSRRSRKSCQNQNPDAIGGTKVPHDRDNTFAPLPRKAHVSVRLAGLVPLSRAGSSESELGKAFIGSLTANEKNRDVSQPQRALLSSKIPPRAVTERYHTLRKRTRERRVDDPSPRPRGRVKKVNGEEERQKPSSHASRQSFFPVER